MLTGFDTPVVLLVYRRPDLTHQLMKILEKVQPTHLFIVADGPKSGEEALCEEVRRVATTVPWPCQVTTRFSSVNLGILHGPSQGLNWVFSQVKEAIILEDDCHPDLSFFYFCRAMLKRYEHEEKIMHITGENYLKPESRGTASHGFSKYPLIWGWATWARSWRYFDLELSAWPKMRQALEMVSWYDSADEQKYWTEVFDEVHKGLVQTWDYSWLFTCFSRQGLCVYPRENLVSNVGVGVDATHTKARNHLFFRATHALEDWSDEPNLQRQRETDLEIFDERFVGRDMKLGRTFYFRLTNPLRRLKHRWKTRRP